MRHQFHFGASHQVLANLADNYSIKSYIRWQLENIMKKVVDMVGFSCGVCVFCYEIMCPLMVNKFTTKNDIEKQQWKQEKQQQ